jgi:uncharacterized membrane protein HdeD (DUF308 family)
LPHWNGLRYNAPPGGPSLAPSGRRSTTCVPFENNMSQLTSKAVLRSAVVIILIGILTDLVALTNPSASAMATVMLLLGVVMIAIASFAGL